MSQGKVNLTSPDVTFWLMITDVTNTTGLGEPGAVPYRLYFGRRIATYDYSHVLHYSLKTRPYTGPTSMDTEMSFIMCNQANVSACCSMLLHSVHFEAEL